MEIKSQNFSDTIINLKRILFLDAIGIQRRRLIKSKKEG